MEAMEHIEDVFKLWPKYAAMAKDIDQEPDTVRKWWMKRIPPQHWPAVIAAAQRRDVMLTAADLMRLNPPRKMRDPASYRRKVRKMTRRAKPRKQAVSASGTPPN